MSFLSHENTFMENQREVNVKELKVLFVILVAGIIIGILGTLYFHKPGIQTITIQTKDTIIITKFKTDTTIITDIVHDTIIITKETPLGQIPVRSKVYSVDIPFLIQEKMCFVPISDSIVYRGILYSASIETKPMPYSLDIPVKQSSPFRILGGVEINLKPSLNALNPIGVLSIGASLKHFKIMGYGLLGPNVPGWIEPRIGAGWCL